MKFIGLSRNFGLTAIWDFSFRGENTSCSDVWPAMDGVVSLSILLEGGATVSNNLSKRHQNGFKIGPRDKYMTQILR